MFITKVCFVENLSSSSLMRRPSKLKSFEFEVNPTTRVPHIQEQKVSQLEKNVRACVRCANSDVKKKHCQSFTETLPYLFGSFGVSVCFDHLIEFAPVHSQWSLNKTLFIQQWKVIEFFLSASKFDWLKRLGKMHWDVVNWQLLVKTVKIVH